MPITVFGRTAMLALVGVGLAAASSAAVGADTPLLEAVKNRDIAAVQALVSQRVDVNIPQADGATALHWAAHWDDVEVADLLIDAGARVNAANDYGVVPLLLAATNGSTAMVARLLSAGADPNAGDENGATPLMFAARTGRIEVAEALLDRGAGVGVKDAAHGQTALMWAASAGHPEVQRVLIRAGADVRVQSARGYTPLLFALRENHDASVRTLLDHGADINDAALDGTTSLVLATVLGHWPLAEFLLDHGANAAADGTGFTALHWALRGLGDGADDHDRRGDEGMGCAGRSGTGQAAAGHIIAGAWRGPERTTDRETSVVQLWGISPDRDDRCDAAPRGGQGGRSRDHARAAGCRRRSVADDE